jgi:hypothetical protein
MSGDGASGPAETRVTIHADQLESEFLPQLIGKVFHVTTEEGLAGIRRDALVRCNSSGELGNSYPQSTVSYGRSQGYVCLFDLRSVPEGELDWALRKFYFLNPSYANDHPLFLFLDQAHYSDVLPWTHAGGDVSLMLIPHVEAWYPHDLPIAYIERILRVTVVPRPPSDFLIALRQANGLQ